MHALADADRVRAFMRALGRDARLPLRSVAALKEALAAFRRAAEAVLAAWPGRPR